MKGKNYVFFSDISEEILGVEHVENWGGNWTNIGIT
jgi:hypothetical protein